MWRCETGRIRPFAKLEKDTSGGGFEFLGVPVLSGLGDGTYGLGGDEPEELSQNRLSILSGVGLRGSFFHI